MARLKTRLAVLFLLSGLVGGTLADAAPPTLTKPAITSAPAAWTQQTSADFTFTSPDAGVSFACRLDGGVWEPCASPKVYSSLAEGSHAFAVKAVSGDDQSTPQGWEWTEDLTPPLLPKDLSVEATSPLGAVVTFAATDNLDATPQLFCAPPSGSAFALGSTSVSCTATDEAGNQTTGGFAVSIRDTTPPLFAPPPSDVVKDVAQSVDQAPVEFESPTAVDAADPKPTVSCSPEPGATFVLGETIVTCVARDASGNKSHADFSVIVQKGPVPSAAPVTTSVPRLTQRTSITFNFSVGVGLTAACRLAGSSGSGTFAPCSDASSQTYSGLADGLYSFTLRVTNSIGNVADSIYSWRVDTKPPPTASRLHVRSGDGRVKLMWQTFIDSDYHHVVISRKRVGTSKWKRIATRRTATSFVDRDVRNNVRYTFAVRSVDRAGNRSKPSLASGRPSKILLPQWGAVFRSPPRIDWVAARRASYYNIQLWAHGRKILSAWPLKSTLRLDSTWSFGGKAYSLTPGRYLVYVWPGFGAKSAVDYGPLLGWTSFWMK
jgi:HYR domain-containing protein